MCLSTSEQSFSINLKIMKLCRLFPPTEGKKFYKIQAYLLQFLLLLPIPILGNLHLLLDENLDMEKVNYNAVFLAQVTCFVIKLMAIIANSEKIKKCITELDSPKFAAVRENHKIILQHCIKVCKRNTLIFVVFVICGASSWATKPLFWSRRNLPLDVWFPLDTTSTPVYCSLYIYLLIGVYFTSFANMVIDPLIAGLAYHATSQIKILKDNLQHLNNVYANEEITSSKNKIIYMKIKRCVQHYDDILSFVKEFEECFSLAIFSQISASVFVICFSCLQLSKIKTFGYYFIQLVFYFGVILAQIYFYCFYGSTLFEESSSIINAVYSSKWYDFDVPCRKALLILMERAQTPITVAAGKIMDLSLVTFATILRRSYSLVAVLNNYQ
ncbi:odorant receptor Or1-like [Tribolium castaneum]|uniref:odorant receptor Or1-like n=1 Tax=Tribolium castaneum TaxID=7070 RepID=UPI0001DCC98E|nr:PREDICTED: odorant receptor Or1-like [Tribolium castaneum]|eukprot:XP_015840044.1 PREDICTED: odorant receptor Or1-like [Tribolium castaneum]